MTPYAQQATSNMSGPFDEQRVTMIITHGMSMVHDIKVENAIAQTMYFTGAYEQFVCVDFECIHYETTFAGIENTTATYHQLVYEFPLKPINPKETVPVPRLSIDDVEETSPLFAVDYHTMPKSSVRESSKEVHDANRIKYAHQQVPLGENNMMEGLFYQELMPASKLCDEAAAALGAVTDGQEQGPPPLSPYCRKLCDRAGHPLIKWRNHVHTYYDSYGEIEEDYTTYVWSGYTMSPSTRHKVVAFIELMQSEDIYIAPQKLFELRRDLPQFPQLRMFYIRNIAN